MPRALAVLAVFALCRLVDSVRPQEGATVHSPPPIEEVERGLQAALGHLRTKEAETAHVLGRLTEMVANTQSTMLEAIQSNNMANTKEAMSNFNQAVQAKKAAEDGVAGAKVMHSLVQAHNTLVGKFIDAVGDFHQSQVADADIRDRFYKENHDEVVDTLGLLKVYQDMKKSVSAIQVKDAEMGGTGVHAAVLQGLKAVMYWANKKTAKVCSKYMLAPGPTLETLKAALALASEDGKVYCQDLLLAIEQQFPEEVPLEA